MTPAQASIAAEKICRLAPVVPVLVVTDLAHATPLAHALVAGGGGGSAAIAFKNSFPPKPQAARLS